MNYVVDMNHATLAAAGDVANADPGENDEDIGFIVTRQDWEQLLNSLEAACDQGPLDIAAHRKIGDGRLEIAYQV